MAENVAFVETLTLRSFMKKTEDKPDYGGFLTTYVKVGDYIFIGDSIIYIKDLKSKGVIVSIRAPKNLIIKKSDNVDSDDNGKED